ncbi:polar-differentiation response regulator DivK [Kordia sp. SMS9]|uniref:response regulator n=1 Tax=Kordia sp. SMS9 TaxID=2282170 RepID=UPI000E0D14BF|nr:response regulator [Kordia sp. SMS9]AXG70808.1 polar-differentiation response regulator DivK [Kordia sp. SMS9]
MNILYVEDNKVNAMVMDKMLSKENARVTIAENGIKALELVEKDTHDVILLDINLGKNQMDGCELLKKIQALPTHKNTPIFAITAYAMPGDETHFINLGFDHYFSKPVNFPALLSALHDAYFSQG